MPDDNTPVNDIPAGTPLTPEVQKMVDAQVAIRLKMPLPGEWQRRLETLRIAQTTLLENKRNLPVDGREITPEEIIAFSDALVSYVNDVTAIDD